MAKATEKTAKPVKPTKVLSRDEVAALNSGDEVLFRSHNSGAYTRGKVDGWPWPSGGPGSKIDSIQLVHKTATRENTVEFLIEDVTIGTDT